LETTGAAELREALLKGGVLDAGPIEQFEQLGWIAMRGRRPCFDVLRRGKLLSGFDLGHLWLSQPWPTRTANCAPVAPLACRSRRSRSASA
jgi:hypothetical protein